MTGKLVVILMGLFVVAAGVSSYVGRAWLAEAMQVKAEQKSEVRTSKAIEVKAVAIPLNTEDTALSTVGELTYVGGWHLISESDDFGGWSGLVMTDANSLLAISDKGYWWQADFDTALESPLSNSSLLILDPAAAGGDKEDYDAESLISTSDGYLVGLEMDHRILHIKSLESSDAPVRFETGVDLSVLSGNSGIEAMTYLANGQLIMFAENGRDVQGRLPAWLVDGDTVSELDFLPPVNFSPTDAAALPDGTMLLLMRHFSVLEGVSIKILHITKEEIDSGVIKGREIVALEEPFSVDNMEGLDVRVNADGSIRLYLISDDNFSFRQRTLLMVFDWVQEAPAN